MKIIKGKALYLIAFAGALAALIIADFVAGINPSWYHVPMFVSAFAFAFLYYKAGLPNMWSYMLFHIAAFIVYLEGKSLLVTGTLALSGTDFITAATAVSMLIFMSAVGVAPVCIAYWAYKITLLRKGR